MERTFFNCVCLSLIVSFFFAMQVNAQGSKTEALLKQLEAAGQVKRSGNVLEFIADKPADTIQLRKKYDNVFKTPDGGSYQLKFSVNPAYAESKKKPEEPQNGGKEDAAGTATYSNQQCFSNIAVFGDSRQREGYLKYQWVVPPGVTKIKIEAWSGGGDGFSLAYDVDSAGLWAGSRAGSGGGGGAYAFAIIQVKPGDKIDMNIPGGGGGKNLLIQVNDILNSLLIANGSDGEPGNYGGKNGLGGHINPQNIRGVFEGKTVWVSGGNGLFNSYQNSTYTEAGNFTTSRITGVEYFGNGGAAAKLDNGGRGGKESKSYSSRGVYANSTNGGFPGGGGGAGFSNYNNRRPSQPQSESEGRGAPGQVIIYY